MVLFKMARGAILPDAQSEPWNASKDISDNLFAYAIGQGPIGTCLGLLVQFAGKGKVLENLQEISRFALRLSISMSLKSSKSFTRQHSQITEMLFKTAHNPS